MQIWMKSCLTDCSVPTLVENCQSLYLSLSFTSCCLCFEKNRLSPPCFPNMKHNNIKCSFKKYTCPSLQTKACWAQQVWTRESIKPYHWITWVTAKPCQRTCPQTPKLEKRPSWTSYGFIPNLYKNCTQRLCGGISVNIAKHLWPCLEARLRSWLL